MLNTFIMDENTKNKLKKEGLEYAEKITKESVECIFNLIEIIIKDSQNKIDDLFLGILNPLKALVIEYVDNIDGEKSNV